jgi:hypothetical protein
MSPKAMNSLDVVEAVILFEEIFGSELPYNETGHLGNPDDMINWLEAFLSNRRPNRQAVALLRRLAKAHNSPELAEGLDGTWRREQIAAILREIFRQYLSFAIQSQRSAY